MRARGVKPGLFKNEVLGTADPLYTVVFEGLWCLADREGRLEDRPLRIHAEINPYRPSASTVQALDWLVLNRFVIRYEHEGAPYLAIVNFREHQQPHIKEPTSKLPAPSNQQVVEARCKHGASTVPARLTPSSLTPDSGLLIPTSGSHMSATPTSEPENVEQVIHREGRKKAPKTAELQGFAVWWGEFKAAYPRRTGDQGWSEAVKRVRARLKEGYTLGQILEGARRYADFCAAKGDTGGQYVKQACNFVGKPQKGESPFFLLPWHAPPKTENASERILRKLNGTTDDRVIEHELPAQPLAIAR